MLDPSKALEWIKLSGKHAIVLFLMSSILLFSSASILEIIGLYELRQKYKLWIGLAWLISLSIIVVESMFPLFTWCKQSINNWVDIKRFSKRLHELSEDEKQFLLGYFQGNTRTQVASIQDGTVAGLSAACIVFRASSISSYHTNFPFNIQNWAWRYLSKHPELLK